MEASFYSDCPTDSIRSVPDNKNLTKQYSSSPESESSDDLINFLDCGAVESTSSVQQHWKLCDISKLNADNNDFASLTIDFGFPLVLRFYVDDDNNVLTQVGSYQNVYLNEMVNCWDCQKQFSKFIYLYIIMECCCEANVMKYNSALREFYDAIRVKKKEVLLKCVLIMNIYEFAPALIESLSSLSDSFLEINIGKSREADQSIVVSPEIDDSVEANGLNDLLYSWLKKRMKALRCLRIYEHILLTTELVKVISGCFSVTHLTLSKIISGKSICKFTNITSFEFDGQYLGVIDDEIRFAKNIKLIFPNVRVVCFKGTSYDPLINAFLRSRYTVESGDTIKLYQPVTDLKKVQHQLSLIYPGSDSNVMRVGDYPRTLTIRNAEYNTRIALYRAGETFKNIF